MCGFFKKSFLKKRKKKKIDKIDKIDVSYLKVFMHARTQRLVIYPL